MTRLYRSTRDKKIFGLCGGLAESFNVDPTLLRLVVVVATFFSAGTVILLYILCSLVIPKEPVPPSHGMHAGPFGGYYGDSYGGHAYSSGGYGSAGYRETPHATQGYAAHANHAPGSAFSGSHQASAAAGHAAGTREESSNLDAMMKEVEVKALRKEIEELKAKLAKFEKGEE